YFKLLKVIGFVRQTKLTVMYQGQTVINNQSGQLSITDLYKSEERSISLEYINDGEVEYTLSLSSDLNLSTKTLVLNLGIKETVQVKIRMSDASSRKTSTIDINSTNISRPCVTLTFLCESQLPQLGFPSEITKEIRIGQSVDMEQLWMNISRSIKLIECDISIKNLGKSAANIQYIQLLSSKEYQYYPTDFRSFHPIIQFKASDIFTGIPYHLEFKIPILEISPKAFFNIGVIKNEKIFKPSIILRIFEILILQMM
ncbi:unnamed protein product, partial [Didymodactylos carnosus]